MARMMRLEPGSCESADPEPPFSGGSLEEGAASLLLPAAAVVRHPMAAVLGTEGAPHRGLVVRLSLLLAVACAATIACVVPAKVGAWRGAASRTAIRPAERVVEFDADHCPGLQIFQSACMEMGNRDGDCCAFANQGECAFGYQLFIGRECDSNGAMTTCCTQLPESEEKRSSEAAEDAATPLKLIVDNFCPGSHVWEACMEAGTLDADCCAGGGKGDCAEGYHFTEGKPCHANGARETCCTKLVHNLCDVPHDWSACTESDKFDLDCCSGPKQANCSEGYSYSPGRQCHKNGASATCCTKLPEKQGGSKDSGKGGDKGSEHAKFYKGGDKGGDKR